MLLYPLLYPFFCICQSSWQETNGYFSVIWQERSAEMLEGKASVANTKGNLGLKCVKTPSDIIPLLIPLNTSLQAKDHLNFTLYCMIWFKEYGVVDKFGTNLDY